MAPRVSHQYIRTQRGDELLNVTHIAGYGVKEIGEFLLLMAYANLLQPTNPRSVVEDGKVLYTADNMNEINEVFKSTMTFVKEGSQSLLDLTTFKLLGT